jgi:hypothetical protein
MHIINIVEIKGESVRSMKDRDSYYRYYKKVKDTVLIEISLSGIRQIYNPLDPSPYPERSLDKTVEDYIVEAVRDFPLEENLELVVYLPEEEMGNGSVQALGQAIGNHFRYKAAQARREMRDTFATGRVGLVIGISFLGLTLFASYRIARNPDTVINEIVRNSLLIIGWVAMWQPISIFFYAWQPFRQKLKIYQKICRVRVSVLPSGDGKKDSPKK